MMRSAINRKAPDQKSEGRKSEGRKIQDHSGESTGLAAETQTPLTGASMTLHMPPGSQAATENEHEELASEDARAVENFVSWREWRALLCLTLAAFLLRLFLVWRFEQVISPDGVQYVTLGRSLLAGNFRDGLSTYWTPLYPLLIGFASLFFRDAEFAARLVSIIAGALLVIPAHRLIRKWYGERAALLGACLVALHPLLIYYSTVVLTESTYTLLFTTGVLAGWTALGGERARSYLFAGSAFGTCYLLKPEACGFLILLLVQTLGRKLVVRAGSFKTSARNGLLLCAGFMLMAAPYLFYLRHETGAWTLSGKMAGHLWQGSRLAAGELTTASLPLMPGLTVALVQLTKALRFEYEIFNLIFPPTFVLLVGLCLFRRRWTENRLWRELYLFSFIAATLAGYAITLPNIRFLMPLLPLLLCWLAQGIIELEGWALETFGKLDGARIFLPYLRRVMLPLVVALLLASLLPLFVYLLRGDKWGDYYGQKRAAAWIKEHDASPAPVIMSSVPITAFYAGGRQVHLLDEDYEILIAQARCEKVSYIIVNERDFRYYGLRPLLDEQSLHPGLTLVHRLAEAPGHRILLYAVDEAEPPAPSKVEIP